MKKRGLLLTGLLALSTALTAQTTIEKRYDATYSTGSTYQPLSAGATEIAFPVDWDDDISAPITMPFQFKYQNTIVASVKAETYGSLLLNGINTFGNDEEDGVMGHILGLYMDYESKSRGKVKYETTGSTGSRIFKIEYANVGRYNDDIGNDTLNFQIWLYESNNAIEYRVGYSNVPISTFGTTFDDIMVEGKEPLFMGILSNTGDSIATQIPNLAIHRVRYQSNTLTDTMLDYQGMVDFDQTILETTLQAGYPPQGSIIKFVPKTTTGIGTIDFNLAKIFPNPSKDGKYTVELKEQMVDAHLFVFDVTGKQVHQTAINSNSLQLDLSNLASGQYFGQIKGLNKTGVFKLIKE